MRTILKIHSEFINDVNDPKTRGVIEVPQDETEHEESIPTPSNDPQPSEKVNDAQAKEIAALKKRVQRLERKKKSGTTGLRRLKKVGMSRRVESSEDQESLGDHEDASKQGRSIEDIDADAEVTLVNETQERQDDDLMFDTGVLDDDEVFVDVTTVEKEEQSTKTGEAVTTAGVEDSAAPTIPTTVEETLAQTLMEIKAAKPKAKGIVFHDQEEQVSVSKPTVSVTQPSVKDKGKGIMIEPEVPLKRKDQVALDEQMARDVQAQLEAEIIEEERLERQKQKEANIALIESWENTQAMIEADRLLAERLQTKKREEKKMLGRKRAGKEQQQEFSKKQRLEEDKGSDEVEEVEEDDEAELKKHLVIKKDEDIAIDAIPLATKPPMIVGYKLLKKGIMVHYQLIRADGSSKRYSSMVRMLQGIDREDLLTLWKLVKTKHGDIRPEDEHETLLRGDFKVIRNLKIQKMNIKFRGGLLGLKRLQGFLEVTTAQEFEEDPTLVDLDGVVELTGPADSRTVWLSAH
ncbi:hypothetical protein Tco_0204105 [Tanacetum coccineum]